MILNKILLVLGLMLLGGLLLLILIDPLSQEKTIKEKSFVYENVKYNVIIDSTATDSLFGKTWRK